MARFWISVQTAGAFARRLLIASLFVPAAPTAESRPLPQAPTPEQVFQGFVDAMNRHDVDAQYAHYAADMRYVDEENRIVPPRESERLDREFERGSGAFWSYEIVGSAPDRLDVILTEDSGTCAPAAGRSRASRGGQPARRCEGGRSVDRLRLRPEGSELDPLPGGPRREYNHAFSPDGKRSRTTRTPTAPGSRKTAAGSSG